MLLEATKEWNCFTCNLLELPVMLFDGGNSDNSNFTFLNYKWFLQCFFKHTSLDITKVRLYKLSLGEMLSLYDLLVLSILYMVYGTHIYTTSVNYVKNCYYYFFFFKKF